MPKLSKKALRIAVAKDVLKSLKGLNVKRGSFLDSPIHTAGLDMADSKAVAVALKASHCRVCALGACFLSLTALDNQFDFTQIDVNGGYGLEFGLSQFPLLFGRLKAIFSGEQLALIERSFEQGKGWSLFHPESFVEGDRFTEVQSARLVTAAKFGYRYEDDSKRLAAIMRNVVKHEGTFRP